nr:LysM peptidoglycan-binding domain-containing protein [Candidatus Nanopelagicales bacterium]
AILVAVPALLVALGAALPVDLGLLAPDAWAGTADGGLLLLLLLAVAWAAWAAMVLTVSVELWSVVRGAPAPRLPGLAAPQRWAAALVAGLLLVPTASWAPVVGATTADQASPSALGALVAGVAAADGDDLPVLDRGVRTSSGADGATGPTSADAVAGLGQVGTDHGPGRPRAVGAGGAGLPTVEVERHDTLWQLAEQHLGDGERFMEIVALNAGVVQADGRALGADGRLYPGWLLRLPASDDGPSPTSMPRRHRVALGDTLWEVAEEHLGQGARYPEVFAANRDRVQPDGARLEDPDLIRPGWVLDLPGTEAAEESLPAEDQADSDGTLVGRVPAHGADTPTGAQAPESPHPPVGEDTQVVAPIERAPASVPAPGGPAPSPTAAAPDPAADPADSAGLPAGGALSALLLAAMAGELVRRRRRFQRLRRPGERMPQPTPMQRALEHSARSAVAEGGGAAADLLDRSLAQLGREAARAGTPVPPVRVVRSKPDSVQLELAEPEGAVAPISPFGAADEGRWVLDPALLETGDPADAGPGGDLDADSGGPTGGAADADPGAQAAPGADAPPALPGLVAIGTAGTETVLVDLTTLGTLQVTGSTAAVADTLRGLTVELGLGGTPGSAARSACLADPALVRATEPGVMAVVDAADAAQVLTTALERGPGVDPVELLVADQVLPDVAVPPSIGARSAGLITSAPVPVAGAVLHVDDTGTAVLAPDGLVLRPSALPEAAASALLGLLAATDIPDDPEGTHPEDSQDADRELPDPADSQARAARAWAGGGDSAMPTIAPRLLVLGQLRVEHAAGPVESTRIGRLAETAAFIHLNPDSRPSALQSALWPGVRSNAQTCRQMITRTRTWLGRAVTGDPHLQQLSETGGLLRLGPGVTSDWDDFQRLAEAGLADPHDTEQLTAALQLVRGRPFGPVAGRELPWTDLHVNTMIELIVDVAHELALRHERAGNPSAARDAALRGLRTECESEVLQAIVARLGRRA